MALAGWPVAISLDLAVQAVQADDAGSTRTDHRVHRRAPSFWLSAAAYSAAPIRLAGHSQDAAPDIP